MRNIRNCNRGLLNTGKSQCPLDLSHIVAAIVVEVGMNWPANATASSIKEACHADRPNRLMPIMTFVEYSKEGGEAQASGQGYGGVQVNSISARTDTFTLDKYYPDLAASLSKAMNLPFEVFYVDENDVVYGRRVGDNLRGFPITTLYGNPTPHPTSSNPATLTVSFAFENARDAVEDFDFIENDFNVKDALVCLTEVELVSTGSSNKYKIVEKVGGLDLTSKYQATIVAQASSVFNGASAASYDAATESLTLTVANGATPSLKAPSALYTAGIEGITP